MAKIVNAVFAKLFTPPTFWYANVAFIISAHIYSSVLHFCDTFAWSRFVQIHFFVQWKLPDCEPVIKAPRVVFSTFYLCFSYLFLNQIIVHSGQYMINWNERVLLKFFWAILQIAATSNLNLAFGQTKPPELPACLTSPYIRLFIQVTTRLCQYNMFPSLLVIVSWLFVTLWT